MCKHKSVVAALLLICLAGMAAAAETNEHASRNAEKILTILNSVGINDPQITQFIGRVDSHIHDKYLDLSEERMMGGNLSFRYNMNNGISTRQLELMYTPDDSHIQAIAKTDGITVNYKLKF
jgi:hypothetical protein